MRKSQIQAMSHLAAANPFHDADPTNHWTQADEDDLLAFWLTYGVGSSEQVRPADSDALRTTAPRRVPPTRYRLLIVVAVVVAAVALVVDLTGSGTPSAFADWTATTTTPPASQLASAISSCSRIFGEGLGKLRQPGFPRSLPPLTLTDSRGPFELLLYSDPASFFMCFWGNGSVVTLGGGSGPEAPTSTHSIGVPQVPFARNADGSGYTTAYGYVGPQVSAVKLNLTNGTSVDATVQNGLFAAWWPVRTDVASADVTTSVGVFHQDFGDDGPNNAGAAQVER